MFQTKVVDKIKTRVLFSVTFSKIMPFFEIMWKSFVERGRPQMTVWCMHVTCWVPKATNTHSGCLIFITFPLEKWLNERGSVLRYTYIAFLTVFAYVIISNDEMPVTHLLVYCYLKNSGCALTANVLIVRFVY
jgi:uncharacterized membrane protein